MTLFGKKFMTVFPSPEGTTQWVQWIKRRVEKIHPNAEIVGLHMPWEFKIHIPTLTSLIPSMTYHKGQTLAQGIWFSGDNESHIDIYMEDGSWVKLDIPMDLIWQEVYDAVQS